MSEPEPGAVSPSVERPREDGIATGTALFFASKVGGAAFTAALVIYLTRALGAAGYGVFALALSVLTLVHLPSDFGVSVALPKFVVEYRDRPHELAEIVGDALRLELVGTFVVAGAMAALAQPIADAYGAPSLAWPLRAMAVALVGQNLLLFATGIFTAARRQALTLISSLAESATEVTASIALVLIFGGATAAACGRAVGYALGGALALFLATRLIGHVSVPRRVKLSHHTRPILRYAVTLAIIEAAYTAFTVIDTLLIGAFLSTAAVGIFSAPARLTTVLQYPGYAIGAAVAPRLVTRDGHPTDAWAFAMAIRLIILLMIPIVALTTVWATPLIHLALGPQYAGSAAVLRGLGPYTLLSGAAALVSTAITYLGAARLRVPIAFAMVSLNALIDVVLIPRIGVLGGVVGTDVAFAVYVLAQLGLCVEKLGLSARPIVDTFVRALAAGAGMACVLAAFGTHRVPIVMLVLGGTCGLAAYLALLLLVGGIKPNELVRAGTALRTRLPGQHESLDA